jgi:hypothetical protein
MNTKQKLLYIVKVLTIIKDNVAANKFPVHGLCGAFKEIRGKYLPSCMNIYGIRFEDWPHFSGDRLFPIPDPTGEYNELEAFYAKAKYTGDYGILRLDLLDWLIKQFEGKLNVI